jgi:hypothetical protein
MAGHGDEDTPFHGHIRAAQAGGGMSKKEAKPSLDYSSEEDAEITKRGLDSLAKAYTKAFSNLPKPPKTDGEVR